MQFVPHDSLLACGRSDRSVQQPLEEASCFVSTDTEPHVWNPNTSPIEDDQSPYGRSGRPEVVLLLERRRVCRVWQASQEATPNPAPPFFKSFISASVFSPILWQPPHPFIPSIRAMGCQCAVGIAFMAAHATACFPLLNCFTLCFMAVCTGIGCWDFSLCHILSMICVDRHGILNSQSYSCCVCSVANQRQYWV